MLDELLMSKNQVSKRRLNEIATRDLFGQCVGERCSRARSTQVYDTRRLGLCDSCYRYEQKDWVGKKTALERQVVIAKKAAQGLLIASRQGQRLPRKKVS